MLAQISNERYLVCSFGQCTALDAAMFWESCSLQILLTWRIRVRGHFWTQSCHKLIYDFLFILGGHSSRACANIYHYLPHNSSLVLTFSWHALTLVTSWGAKPEKLHIVVLHDQKQYCRTCIFNSVHLKALGSSFLIQKNKKLTN